MLLLVLDVDHFIAVFTFPNIAAAIGFVEVDAIKGEHLVAVTAFLVLCLHSVIIQITWDFYIIISTYTSTIHLPNKYSPRAPFYFKCFAFISQLLFGGTNINFFFLNRLIIL